MRKLVKTLKRCTRTNMFAHREERERGREWEREREKERTSGGKGGMSHEESGSVGEWKAGREKCKERVHVRRCFGGRETETETDRQMDRQIDR